MSLGKLDVAVDDSTLTSVADCADALAIQNGKTRELANRIRLNLTHLALEIRINEYPDLTVEDSLGIAHADVCAVISDHGVRMKDVGANAVAEAGCRVLALEPGTLLGFGVHLPLEEPG